MLPENQNHQPEAEKVVTQYVETRETFIVDLELDKREEEKLASLAAKVREFSGQSPDAIDAIEKAIDTVAQRHKIFHRSLYEMIWGTDIVKDALGKNILRDYQNLKKTLPQSLVRFALKSKLSDQNIDDDFFKSAPEYTKDAFGMQIFLEAVQRRPQGFVRYYQELKGLVQNPEQLLRDSLKREPTAIFASVFEKDIPNKDPLAFLKGGKTKEVVQSLAGEKFTEELWYESSLAAAKKNPRSALQNLDKIRSKQFNGKEFTNQVLIIAAQEDTSVVFDFLQEYQRLDSAEEIIKQAVFDNVHSERLLLFKDDFFEKAITGKQYTRDLLVQCAQYHPREILEHYRELSKLNDIGTIIYEAAVNTAKLQPDVVLMYYKSFQGALTEGQKKELLQQIVPSTVNKSPSIALAEFENYKEQPNGTESFQRALTVALEKEPRTLFARLKDYRNRIGDEATLQLLKKAAEKSPYDAINEFRGYESFEPHAESILREAAQKDPSTAIRESDAYMSKPYAKEVFLKAASTCPEEAIRNIKRLSTADWGETLRKIILDVAQSKPWLILRYREDVKSGLSEKEIDDITTDVVERFPTMALKLDPAAVEKYVKNHREKAPAYLMNLAMQSPYSFQKHFSKEEMSDTPNFPNAAVTSERLVELGDSFLTPMTHAQRADHAQDVLKKLFRERYETEVVRGLKACNDRSGTALEFRGIRRDDSDFDWRKAGTEYAFVFVNTFADVKSKKIAGNILPIAIAITPMEMQRAVENGKVSELLQEKLDKEATTQKEDRAIWQSAYEKMKGQKYSRTISDKTAVMLALDAGEAQEFDYVMDLYESQGASIQKITVPQGLTEKWKVKANQSETAKTGKTPEVSTSNADSILRSLSVFLTEAILSGKEDAIYHYKIHGARIGSANTTGRLLPGNEVAKAISLPFKNPENADDPRNGKPLCSLIPIRIYAESCYAGMQRDSLMDLLKREGTPVKDLEIITPAEDTESYWAGQLASLSTETIGLQGALRGRDRTPFHFYLDYYYEMIAHLKERGVEIKEPLGTRTHALHFAERMVDFDGWYHSNQEVRGLRYSTEQKINDEWFSFLEDNSKAQPNKAVA